MYKIRLTERAQKEVMKLNSSRQYLRLYTSGLGRPVVYQVVDSASGSDEVIECCGCLIFVDKNSKEYLDGDIEIHYSDNPGWSYTKSA